jgi:hypothetical protein
MFARSGSARLRYSIRGLITVVAVAAIVSAWISWMLRPEFPVSGIVTYNGQPLDNGKIIFLSRNSAGPQVSGQVVDGRFTLPRVAVYGGANSALYDVVVASEGLPAKYGSRLTSGLNVKIKKGNNTTIFELTD